MDRKIDATALVSRAQVLLLLVSTFVLQACYPERLARSKLTGYVLDAETHHPIEGVQVGETKTDSKGYYELRVRVYRQFTWVGMEAPPVMIQEWVGKEGYEDEILERFSTYGGSGGRDSHWEIEPIYLRKTSTSGK